MSYRFRPAAKVKADTSCVPAAANLLRTANVSPTDSRRRVAAGRRWLRSYINGCGYKVWRAPLHATLQGKTFSEAAEWSYRSAGFVLIGNSLLIVHTVPNEVTV